MLNIICKHILIVNSMRNIVYASRKVISTATKTNACNSIQSWQQPEGHDTGIKIYNCIASKNVPLILRHKNFATWYTCGPTVYDSTHIGHASCYVKLDILQRILRNYFNINLITAMNITDIDDKIIKTAIETNKNYKEITQLYETEFWNDLKALNVELPIIKIRVTENIPLIVAFIDEILKKQLAYIGHDKSVYFKVSAFPNYGKLQKLELDSQEHDLKESNIDFALWKAKKNDNEPYWSTPWSNGRPGWHIECSTLASKIFGNNLDFHAGGLDLKFPHHENEEAQSCAYHNVGQWVNYWIHTGHLNLKGQNEKMSKSLKNTISISEMLSKYSNDEFRLACLMSNYRTSMDYSDEMMKTAKNTLLRFHAFESDCQAYFDGKKRNVNINSEIIYEKLHKSQNNIDVCLKDDFNTAKCISHLLDLSGTVSKMINTTSNIDKIEYFASDMSSIAASYKFIEKMLKIFGLQQFKTIELQSDRVNSINIENIIEEIVEIRKRIREKAVETKNKDLFKVCDEIRSSLGKKGIEIKDHDKESSWNYKQNL